MGLEKIKGIIFDLDGVIVFTDELHYQAWRQIARKLGVYFDEQINNRLRGVSRMESLEIILERYFGAPLSREEKINLAEEKNRYYCEMLHQMQPKDVGGEVRETLRKLREKGYALAIGSSSRNAKTILAQVGLAEAFDSVSDGTNISRSKPDPEVFLKAAEYLGLQSEQCLVVEDAKAGIDAAKAGGMMAAAVGDAVGYERADLELKDIPDILEKLR